MSGLEIKREIEKTIASGSYGSWTIGVTDSTAIARARLQNPECWHSWQADSPQEAKSVHNFFRPKRMRNGNSSGAAPTPIILPSCPPEHLPFKVDSLFLETPSVLLIIIYLHFKFPSLFFIL